MATASQVPAPLSPPLEVTEREAPPGLGPVIEQATAAMATGGENELYWGDGIGLEIWLGCAGLIVALRAIDLVLVLLTP